MLPDGMTAEAVLSGAVLFFGGLGIVWGRITALRKKLMSAGKEADKRAELIEINVADQASIVDELTRQVGELSTTVATLQVAVESKDRTIDRLRGEVESLREEVSVLRERDKANTAEIARLRSSRDRRE